MQEKTEKDRLRQDYRAKMVLTEHNFKAQLVRQTCVPDILKHC